MSESTPQVGMAVEIDPGVESVTATVTLSGFESPYKVSADAPRSPRHPHPPIEYELAVSRALAALQHCLMEHIHEQIDRTVDDV